MRLTSNDVLTQLALGKKVTTWQKLVEHVSQLPYGRNSSRSDFGQVLTEQKGSCSSKHALLKSIADLNGIDNIELVLGIYKMDDKNTLGIGSCLQDSGLDYIPEAHCYLKINNERKDHTTINSSVDTIADVILAEHSIEPQDVVERKVEIHKSFIRDWSLQEGIDLCFEELWEIREQCIKNLTEKNNLV